ncbi:tudor domain-containing protein 1 [Anabrus simplex]|uniref:tudor domain-containing protein 1 n=1 Tax=Anabrus simplex TaxID=316456 RepID=UPI0035A3061E
MTTRSIVGIFVTFVEAEGPLLKVWGQIDRSSAICIERMILQYSEEFKKGCGVPHGSTLYSGLVCCARYEGDGVFYRAKITSLDKLHKGEIFVKFIDYGNTEFVSLNNIRVLNTKNLNALSSIPSQAEEFYLAGVIPPMGEWDANGLSFIRQNLCYVELKGVIVSTVCFKKLLLLLYDNTDFSQVLIEKNLGISIDISAQEVLLEGLFGGSRGERPEYATQQHLALEVPAMIEGEGFHISHVYNEGVNKMLTVPVLEVNSEHAVRVSHIEDGPAAFSVQLTFRDNVLKTLTDSLNDFTPRPLTEPLLPGSVCLGRCPTNGLLCRAVVMSVHEYKCKLYFVDFGNSEIVPYSEIYELPHKHMIHKSFAINFTLAGLQDISLSAEAKVIFSELVGNRMLSLRVVPPQGPRIKQYGDLYLNNQNVLLMLVQRLESLRRMRIFPSLPFPAIGAEELVTVSYVASVSNFFVHFEKNSGELDKIANYIEIHCSGNVSGIMANQLSSGTPVCALYSSDKQWYRAKVMSVAGDSVSVLYVDYGNTDILPVSSLKQMDENLMKIRAQAIACCLNGFQNLENNERESAKLEEDTAGKVLKMVVVDHMANGMLLVDLVDLQVAPSVNIGNDILTFFQSSHRDGQEDSARSVCQGSMHGRRYRSRVTHLLRDILLHDRLR